MDYVVSNLQYPTEIIKNMTVIEGFDKPSGKFPNTLGNVALIDCHDSFSLVISPYLSFVKRI